MSLKIYWGRPGSYKTSSAVKTDLPDFAFAGRVVVTNVRGLNDTEKVKRVLEKQFKKNIPDTFEIINVESDSVEGKDKWAKFFHWAPKGCAFIVDEVQDVWKKKWAQTFLNTLDYEGGADKAKADGRPLDFAISFDQHRHYNWDFVLTTPHIKKIRDDIREICDFAYKHRNQALIGVKGCFNQFGHDPDNNCRADKEAEVSRYGQKIPKWVWQLYSSTATGKHSDTRSGFKWWKDPKIMMLGLLAVLIWIYVGFHYKDLAKRLKAPDELEEINQGTTAVQKKKQRTTKNSYFEDLGSLNIFYSGMISNNGNIKHLFIFEESSEKQGTIVDDTFFKMLGYAIENLNENMVVVFNENERYFFKSKGVQDDKKMF